ncbi:hypothetical protein RB195_004040 [Necator americanus]|uniref:Uncharacterized protein n=1 Tax=Necator americanus TaxID=51031 RepID=A0ABR1BG02_NECAM
MFRTAVSVTSDVHERIDAVIIAQRIAISSGYIADVRGRPGLIAQRDYAPVDDPKKINFCLPFMTDDLSKAIRASLVRYGLDDQARIAEMPPTNPKKHLSDSKLCNMPIW